MFSWDLLRRLSSFSTLPWIVARGFDEILYVSEKTGQERNNWQIENFRNAILDFGLFDLGFDGPKFTWKGLNQGTDYIKDRLDHIFATTYFSQVFLTFFVKNTSVSRSDHLSLILHLENSTDATLRKCHRVKRFEPHWRKDEDCTVFFEKLWLPESHPSSDSIRSNIGSILEHLLEWSKTKYGVLPSYIKKARNLLDELRTWTS